jgi:hypothetical protein
MPSVIRRHLNAEQKLRLNSLLAFAAGLAEVGSWLTYRFSD